LEIPDIPDLGTVSPTAFLLWPSQYQEMLHLLKTVLGISHAYFGAQGNECCSKICTLEIPETQDCNLIPCPL
jgi:hypothetical protein